MTERKISGLFLGVPVLSQGSFTEDDRLRRDGFGYGIQSLFFYRSSDYVTASILALLCLSTTIYLNASTEPQQRVRITIHIAYSITLLIAVSRSGIDGLALPVAVGIAAYYGLMYFTRFDR